MKKVQDPSIDDNSDSSPVAQQHDRRFGPILSALHESRRKQAADIISGYRHLIDERSSDEIPWIQQLKTGAGISRGSVGKSRRGPWRLILKPLMVLVILGFGILHLIGGSIIEHVSVHRAAASAVLPLEGD